MPPLFGWRQATPTTAPATVVTMGTTAEWSRLPVGRREFRQDALLALVLGAGLAITTMLYGSAGTYGDDQAAWWVSALLVVALKKWVGRKELAEAEAPELAAVAA